MSINAEQARLVFDQADCLYTNKQVMTAIKCMADEIIHKFSHTNPIFLCVLSGGIIPMGHLLTLLEFPLHIDYIHATRYQGDISGGTLSWIANPTMSLKDRNVILVDDILDEGITLHNIVEYCKNQGVKSVYTAVLVNKLHQRKLGFQADIVGLEVEDRYVFGYGMDYKGYLRNASGIYAVKGL